MPALVMIVYLGFSPAKMQAMEQKAAQGVPELTKRDALKEQTWSSGHVRIRYLRARQPQAR